MNYFCKYCNYKTSRKSNYNEHILTQKHISKCKLYFCEKCGDKFLHASSLSKHKKKCNYSANNDIPTKSDLKDVLDLLKSNNQIMSSVAKANMINAETASNATKAVMNATEANIVNAKTTRQSVNMMTFAMRHFESAPPLRKLDKKEVAKSIEFFKDNLKRLDYSKDNNLGNLSNLNSLTNIEFNKLKKSNNFKEIIENYKINEDSENSDNNENYDENLEDIVNLEDIINISSTFNKKEKNEKNEYSVKNIMEYAEIILGHYRMNNLKSFIGEIIKHCRRKTNPNNNSIWETDISRLNFIVKYEGTSYNKSLWIKDECGDVIKTVVIVNLCDDIKTILLEYVHEMNKNDAEFLKSEKNLIHIMKRKEDAVRIARMVQKEDFHNKILKYIAPSFRFNDMMMEYYDNKFNDKLIDFDDCENIEEIDSLTNIDKKIEPVDKIYEILKEIFINTEIIVYDNAFVELYFESCEEIVNIVLKYENKIICVYYKHENTKIIVDEIKKIKKISYKLITDDKENVFSKKIKESIPLIIHNNKLTQDEMELLLKYKVKHIELVPSVIKTYIFDLLNY